MIDIKKSTQFVITDLYLDTKIGKIDLKGLFEEINIFDSIFNPCMSGNILIKDSLTLSNSILFDGSEILYLKISKTDNNLFEIQKKFRIYKQTNRKIINQNSESYILHFISEEFFNSSFETISRAYETTYGETIFSVMQEYLKIENENINICENTLGLKKFIIPNLKPIDSIIWMTKKSIDKDGFPTFLFFENIDGYNFVSLSTLIRSSREIEVFFNPKNLNEDPIENLFNVSHFEVLQQFNALNMIQSGVYSGKFIGFDPGTNSVQEIPISFFDWYEKMPHLNSSPNIPIIITKKGNSFEQFNAKLDFYPSYSARQYSSNVKENNSESITFNDDTERYIFQRKPIFSNFLNQKVKIVMPGNFSLTSGTKINLNVPSFGFRKNNTSNMDKTLFGKYLITSTRHIIKYDRHETIVEASTDSSNKVESQSILGNFNVSNLA
jgi:hypothetical protein